jgi:hypothetical protein
MGDRSRSVVPSRSSTSSASADALDMSRSALSDSRNRFLAPREVGRMTGEH